MLKFFKFFLSHRHKTPGYFFDSPGRSGVLEERYFMSKFYDLDLIYFKVGGDSAVRILSEVAHPTSIDVLSNCHHVQDISQ